MENWAPVQHVTIQTILHTPFFDIKDEFNVNVWNSSYKLVEKGQYFSMTPFVQTWCLADYVCYSVIGTLQ